MFSEEYAYRGTEGDGVFAPFPTSIIRLLLFRRRRRFGRGQDNVLAHLDGEVGGVIEARAGGRVDRVADQAAREDVAPDAAVGGGFDGESAGFKARFFADDHEVAIAFLHHDAAGRVGVPGTLVVGERAFGVVDVFAALDGRDRERLEFAAGDGGAAGQKACDEARCGKREFETVH
jgi:hypothetical protein